MASDGGSAADAGADVDGGLDAGVRRWDWSLRVKPTDGGVWLDLPFADDAVECDPASALELSTPVPLADFRLRLFDWRDAVVVSDEAVNVDDAGTRWLVEPTRPLAPGRSYSVRLEAQRGADVLDALGHAWPDWELALRVRGEVEPEPKPARRRRR